MIPTVVIATRDRREELLHTLERLAALPEAPAVIVVDNGSTDGAPAAVRAAHPGVTVIELGEDRGAAARTAGVLAATAPSVAFCDDDSWWAPGALERAGALLDAHPAVGLLAARVLLPGGRADPTCTAMEHSALGSRPGLPGPRVLGFIACGAVVRRDAYLAAGGFPPGWGVGGEELPFAAALADRGWDLVHVPALVAHHHPSSRRDPARRAAVAARNDLWSAWALRPSRDALRVTARSLLGARDRGRRRGLAEGVRGLGPVLATRRPVGPRVAAELNRLERATSARPSGSRARSRRATRP
jgi:GT2 family glycosyltransferase